MTPEVEKAIREIRDAFPDRTVEILPESQGGADVIVHDLSIGDQYDPPTSWVGFLIPFSYPRADIYPHWIDPKVARRDGLALGRGFSGPKDYQGRQAWMVSLKSHHWDPSVDTAATKLAQVLDWMNQQ